MTDIDQSPELKRREGVSDAETRRLQKIIDQLGAAVDEQSDLKRYTGVELTTEFFIRGYRCTFRMSGVSESELLPRAEKLAGMLAAAGAKGGPG